MALEQLKKQISCAELIQTPAHIIVGPQEHTLAYAHTMIKTALCSTACGSCITCRQIEQHAHHSVMWIEPEKSYTLAHLDDLFNTLSLSLEQNESYFFVLQKADTLTQACANRLLKSLEEPPEGYHFILLVERTEHILPTIRSRCIIHVVTGTASMNAHSPLFEWFTIQLPAPSIFLKYLDDKPVSEHETLTLLDTILSYWTKQYSKALADKNSSLIPSLSKKIDTLKTAYQFPPMPGSSKIFWKDLFIQMI